ncbi:MAG TPA: S8 family serine peptidase [Actinomycetota bacterium]
MRRRLLPVAVGGVLLAGSTPALAASGTGPAAVRSRPPAVHTVLVRFRDGAGRAARSSAVARVGGTVLSRIYGLPVTVVRIPEGAVAADVARRLAVDPDVAWAEPDSRAHAAGTPDDPSFSQQWSLNNTGQTGGVSDADIDAPEGWDTAGLGAWPATGGTRIGFVDSGIDTSHPEFAGRIAGCVHTIDGTGTPTDGCTDQFGHGSHVAGIAAASTNNAKGIAGISFDSPILVCKALDQYGWGWNADVAACIVWLHDQGAKVINMSLVDATGSEMGDAVQAAWQSGSAAGSVLVAAAGNTGGTAVKYPAGYGSVISVGNTDSSDHIASSSTHNADVELSAPGTSILSTSKSGGYTSMSGTSMATAMVSGVAAVTWELNPSDTAQQIRDLLHAAVDDLGAAGRDDYFGYGRIDLCDAAGGSCAYTPGGGQQTPGSISGTVTTTAGQPLKARVKVVSGPTLTDTRSDSTGAYTLANLTPGSYSVKARKRGCTRQTKPATVSSGATTTLNFALSCGS